MVHNKEEGLVDKSLKEDPMEHFILSSVLFAATTLVFYFKARKPAYRPVKIVSKRRH